MTTIIETNVREAELSQRQRWSHYFALAFGVLGIIIGVNLRDTTLRATTFYQDTRAGIRAFYPQNWLIDTSNTSYIFSVSDISVPGYKTTIRVSAVPISAETTSRNVLEELTLNRSQTLAQYSVFTIGNYPLPDNPDAISMQYAFASGESDPFLSGLPSVVRGLDVLAIKRGQAVIITFLCDARTYDDNLPIFEQFLNELEF
jgi:hypothetical protein